MARPRYGYRRLQVLVERQGLPVNAKKVYRLYREEELAVRRRKRKRMAGVAWNETGVIATPVRRASAIGPSFEMCAGPRGPSARIDTVVPPLTSRTSPSRAAVPPREHDPRPGSR